jgi:hypothetical protein
MQELERILKKTQENFATIQKNVKSHILEDPLLMGSLSSDKKNKKEDVLVNGNRFIEENNKDLGIKAVCASVPMRKSLDSNLTKSSNNFFDKTLPKHEADGNLTDYIIAKGGKIFNNLTQKKIFLTPKGVVI